MNDRITTLLEGRRGKLERRLGRSLETPPGADGSPLTEERRAYLLDEAKELYWNELEWEHIMEEERLDEGALTELAFPGLLAFVRGLLLQEALPDSRAPAQPRPEVVQDLLRFLGGRVVELRDEIPDGDPSPDEDDESRQGRAELVMTNRLVDLVLYELYDLDEDEVERVEAVARTH